MTIRSPSPNELSKEDDAVEIEVVPANPAPAPQRRVRARTPNPVVDEVIHSGEIEARSRIIRVSDSHPVMPKIEIREDPTEPVARPRLPAGPPKRRLRALWLVAAIVSALAAGAVMLTEASAAKSPTHATVGLEPTAEMIGTALDAEARAAQVRVEAMASSSMLRAGIETDAQTLSDMARDRDLVVPVVSGEVVEVFQIRDGARTSMLRVPPTAPTIQPLAVGTTRIEAHGSTVSVVANATVARRESGISGEVVISVPVDLEPIKRRVAEHALEASLIGLGAPIVLVPSTGKPGTALNVPIPTKILKAGSLSLATVLPASAITGVNELRIARYACLGLAGLLLLIFAASLVRRST